MKHKERLDVLLVSLGLAESRAKAQATIMAGEVYVNGQKADKSGMEVDITSNVEVRGSACPYVSRGGLKLEKALRNFGVDRRAMSAATPVRLRADLPTVCSSRAPARSLPSTSATDSWRGKSATIRASWLWSGRTSAT